MKSSMNPIQLWGRSLPFRVVLSTLAASVVILLLTGWFLMEQSTRGIIEGKTQASIAEASAVMTSMQRDLSTTDLRTTSLGERITRLGRDATNRGQTGNQYYVAIETPISQIGSAGVSAASIPANIRNAVDSAGSLWSTPTLIQFTDNRASEPGLVVAGELIAPGQGAYPVYFLFPTTQERQTIAVVQQAALATGVILLAGLGVVVYVMVVQVLRPVRAARLAAERLAAGHLDDRMAVEGVEDLAGLARSMNHMAAELEHKVGELEELSTVQQRFVSDVSHELRTPLTTIRMASEVLYAQRKSFNSTSARSAELLSAELDRFESLLADLLEISRFDAGAAELSLEVVDLGLLVGEELEALRPLAERAGSSLSYLTEGNGMAEIDRRRIQRIVRNLITNAIEHGEGKPIEVRLRSNAGAVAVAVRDHGVGFSMTEGAQLFNRFWRADPSRGRRIGGTGLGLSISLEDARLHGGWLTAWGERGNGAQFRLTLPRSAGGKLKSSPLPAAPEPEEQS